MWLPSFLLCHQLAESMGIAGTLLCVGVAACTPEVPTCRGCPHGRPEVQGQLIAPSTSIKQATPANFLLVNTVK